MKTAEMIIKYNGCDYRKDISTDLCTIYYNLDSQEVDTHKELGVICGVDYIATKYNDDTGSFEVFATGADALSIRNDEIDYIMCGGVECVRYLDNSTRCYINAVLGEELF